MTKIAVRDSVTADCIFLGPRLRPEDKRELAAVTKKEPTEALRIGLNAGAICKTALMQNEDDKWYPVGMFGITPDLDAFGLGIRAGAIWYLGSSDIYRAQKDFMRLSRKWVEILMGQYDFLFNYVDARNTRHIAWLQRLGFEFINCDPNYRGSGLTFCLFKMGEAPSV